MPDQEKTRPKTTTCLEDVYLLLTEYYKLLDRHGKHPDIFPLPVHPFKMSVDELVAGLQRVQSLQQ